LESLTHNNLDEAAGYASQGNGVFHATAWNHDGTVSDLLALNGFDSSLASGINDSGTVVGVSFSSQNLAVQSGFKWTQATGMQAIDGAATATSINSAGDISGMTPDSRAAIFTTEGTTINLGTLGDFSIALAVNDSRHAVGYSPLQSGGPVHAFFYNGVLQDLGTIQPGSNTTAASLNNADIVVGSSNLAGHSVPWVWSATTGMQDLNSLISPDSGWVLVTATSVDQEGSIVGAGIVAGAVHGFLLTPD
jgi:probable HAF family extracellular repeat protein